VRFARRPPAAGVAVTVSGVIAGAASIIGQVIEVVLGIVCLQVMHSSEDDDENQYDNCSQADHDQLHRTIQGGMAWRRRQLGTRGHHASLPR
jgi:hypothetical protein